MQTSRSPFRVSHIAVFALLFLGQQSLTHGQVTTVFEPSPYLQSADLPAEFCEDCQLEDFEDNAVDAFLSMDCGEILPPNVADPRLPGLQITDSVDGDDGLVDGNGNGGHSYFCADPIRSITVEFAEPVIAAGAVWTDGDRGVAVQLEAFDAQGRLIQATQPAELADGSYFGETAEDHFLGVRSNQGVASITISTIGQGAGIEIDHVRWDAAAFEAVEPSEPEPVTIPQLCSGLAAGNGDLNLDINQDGLVDQADLDLALLQLGTVAGDADLDGDVDFTDFSRFSASFLQPADWAMGDFDCDGEAKFGDFLILARNFGFDAADASEAASVPEPAMDAALMIGLVCAQTWRRRSARRETERA